MTYFVYDRALNAAQKAPIAEHPRHKTLKTIIQQGAVQLRGAFSEYP